MNYFSSDIQFQPTTSLAPDHHQGPLKLSPFYPYAVVNKLPIIYRSLDDTKHFNIGSKKVRLSPPVTFTPYASAKPCSARCGFCSENLLLKGEANNGSNMRPDESYHVKLRRMLTRLRHIPLGLSLSGLEITDNVDWLNSTIDTLLEVKPAEHWVERAAYSNGAGFAAEETRIAVVAKLRLLKLHRFEISRHHFDASLNQAIMQFRPEQAIQKEGVFSKAITNIVSSFPLSLVCIIQLPGICSFEDTLQYLHWANDLGVSKVIFRELCQPSPEYKNNRTVRHIASTRIDIEPIIKQWLENKLARFCYLESGYYFWNAKFVYKNMDVIFEKSYYENMLIKHKSNTIYKLVYYANGNLCSGWNPLDNIVSSVADDDK